MSIDWDKRQGTLGKHKHLAEDVLDMDTGSPTVGEAVVQAVLSVTVTLTNAQVLTLVEGPYPELVPAPGAGKVIVPLEGGLMVFTGSVAYSNVDNGATLNFGLTSGHGLLAWLAEPMLTFGADAILPLTPKNASVGSAATGGPDSPSTFDNIALRLSATNAALGDFEGGDAANTLEVTVVYTIIDLP